VTRYVNGDRALPSRSLPRPVRRTKERLLAGRGLIHPRLRDQHRLRTTRQSFFIISWSSRLRLAMAPATYHLFLYLPPPYLDRTHRTPKAEQQGGKQASQRTREDKRQESVGRITMASYIVTGIHAAARAGKYGKVSDAQRASVGFRPPVYFLSARVYCCWVKGCAGFCT